MATKIQLRRDTSTNWGSNNPVLASGEVAFSTDLGKIKIGNGTANWQDLPYLHLTPSEISSSYQPLDPDLTAIADISASATGYVQKTGDGTWSIADVTLGLNTDGNYVETIVAGDGVSVSGEGTESASVTITNTGVLSLAGTTNEVEVSASSGNVTLSLPTSITVDLVGNVTGNADTASTLATSRSISLDGDVSGSASFNGGSDITITAEVADDSHNHIISNVDGLQDELNLKAPLESPALTGTPTAPTASASANSTQIATTAFVQTNISNLINGAPGALDTLDELAAALGDDANFASTVTNSLAGKQPLDADLTAIAELSASATGFLKKDAENTWSLDTNTYLTGNETITVSGDASGSGSTSISLTLANSGVSASTYGAATEVPVITVDSKGRLTNVTTAAIVSLPDQTGNSGKYLTTNGTNASWATIDLTAYAELSGATFTGVVSGVSASAAGSSSFRKTTMSTSAPTGGADGDVWLVYS